MAVPRIGQEIVRARPAILARALFHDRCSDCSPLVHTDRAVFECLECLVVPDMRCSLMCKVHYGRTRDDTIVVARELQSLMQGLPAAARAALPA